MMESSRQEHQVLDENSGVCHLLLPSWKTVFEWSWDGCSTVCGMFSGLCKLNSDIMLVMNRIFNYLATCTLPHHLTCADGK